MELQKIRNSNLELLRIIAIIFIIIHHVAGESVWYPVNPELQINDVILKSIYGLFGNVGNCFFILITGYFLMESKFSWKKFINLWIQIFLTSAIIGIIFYLFKIPTIGWSNYKNYVANGINAFSQINKKDLLRSFLPNYYCNLWYATTFLLFYIFSPFLRILIRNLSRKQHFTLMIILLLMDSFLRYLPGQKLVPVDKVMHFFNLSVIITYIKIYNPSFFRNTKRNLVVGVIIFICLFMTVFCLYFLVYKKLITLSIANILSNRLTKTFSFMIIYCILCIFLFFSQIELNYNFLINKFANCSFGIYLIHENFLVNHYIYHKVFDTEYYRHNSFFIIYIIFITLIVYIVCMLIELIRKLCIKKVLEYVEKYR